MFALIAGVGLSQMQYTGQNSPRNIFILGFGLYMGLSVPYYFVRLDPVATPCQPRHTSSSWLLMLSRTLLGSISSILSSLRLNHMQWRSRKTDCRGCTLLVQTTYTATNGHGPINSGNYAINGVSSAKTAKLAVDQQSLGLLIQAAVGGATNLKSPLLLHC